MTKNMGTAMIFAGIVCIIYALFTIQIPTPWLFPQDHMLLVRGVLLIAAAVAAIAMLAVIVAGLWGGAGAIYSALWRRLGKRSTFYPSASGVTGRY